MCATACKVYRQDLLGQKAAGAAGASGAAPAGMGGSGGSEQDGSVTEGTEAGAPALDLPMCAGGDCWWSRSEGESCRSAGMPKADDRPSLPDTSRVADIYLGFTQIRLGATRSDGMRAEDAWESLGFDLDGLCTNSGSCEGTGATACRSPGPATPYDGQLCRDNTFGRLQPVIANLRALGDDFGLSEDAFNCELWRGGYNMLVRISGYNGTPDDPFVRVDYYLSPGLEETVPWKCPTEDFRTRYPRWRSARTWAVDEGGLTGPITKPGALPDSKFADGEAYVKNNYLVARVPDGSSQGFMGTGEPYRGFVFKPRGGLFVGRLQQIKDGTWELSDGMLGGRIAKSDLVSAFRETGFCEAGEVNSFYQSVLEFIDETADMLAGGEIDPNKPCDAMSYAVAFAASQLLPGQAVKVPPRAQCCAPGKTLDECNAQCGDGKVSGKEKCDSAIAEGMPGACPKQCPAASDCAPQQLSGSGCNAECKPLGMTMVGVKDGCCPKGANVTSDSDCVAQCGNNVVESGETCDPPMSCKTCTPLNSCYRVSTMGSAADCNVRCEQTAIKDCAAGDSCCPAGCTNANDADCPATCKNGRLDQGEACENGTERSCPMSCDDRQPCTVDAATGSADNCSLVCTHTRITAPASGDGCCPEGASANVDGDCQPRCGNKVVEMGEQCDDGNELAGDSCFDCKTEDVSEICLMKQGGTSDDCAKCTCAKCTREALDCYAHENSTDARLCRDMVRCARESRCGNPDCFCGTVSLFGCLNGLANGPCKQRIQEAAKSDSLIDIDVRGRDLNYPLARANAVFTCRERSCAQECGLR